MMVAWMHSGARLAVVALSMAGAACPGRGGPTDSTPPFVNGGAVGDLGEPPGPDPEAFGLAWMEQIYPRLRDDWVAFVNDCRLRLPASNPLNDSRLVVVISADVARSGGLLDAAVSSSSGNQDFDGVALEIVREAAPFPQPPAELVSDDDRVHLRWAFHRDHRLAGPATAVVDRVEWPVDRAVPALLASGGLAVAARRIEASLDAGGDPATAVAMTRQVAVAFVRAALASTDATARSAAMAAVVRARMGDATAELRRIAGGAAEPALQREAVAALGTIRDAGATDQLLGLLDSDPDEATAAATVDALGALGKGSQARQRVVARLTGADHAQSAAALAVAAQVAVPEAVTTLAAMTGDATPRPQRLAACAALGLAASGNRDLAAKGLRKGLDARDAAVRAACAQGLAVAAAAGLKSKMAYWRAVELLRDRDERVRAAALLAAARLDPAHIGAELYTVVRDRSPTVLAALATALAVIPGELDRLTALARSGDVEIRRNAAAALAARTDKAAREALAGMLGDADPAIQLSALTAVDGPEAFERLLDAADPAVRTAAFARLVAARGQAATAATLCGRLADDELGADEAARLAGAWLAPSTGP